jgi:hypothetical protein
MEASSITSDDAATPGPDNIWTVEELEAAACATTGLDDFGGDDYREGLGVLLESYSNEAGLTALGRKINHAMLRGALGARQLCEAAARRYPGHAAVQIERPIVVTGLPRTGTTALHRLLCEDPGHQGLELWLTEAPQPRPARETWAADPAFQRIDERYRRHNVANPEFMGVHYVSADTVEECWQLLRQSMLSISFETLAHVPGYSNWLAGQDWTVAYRRHRRNLQVIGLGDARRWALKSPSHLFSLPALLEVYPDAMIVQTHRDPTRVIASMSSLAAQATTGQSDVFQGHVIGRTHLDLWARGAERFMADRERYHPAQFMDVRYEAFVADPIGTVEMIYAHFGLRLSAEARSAMTALHAESASGERQPAHRYELADFGLTAGEVDERFSCYRNAYGV